MANLHFQRSTAPPDREELKAERRSPLVECSEKPKQPSSRLETAASGSSSAASLLNLLRRQFRLLKDFVRGRKGCDREVFSAVALIMMTRPLSIGRRKSLLGFEAMDFVQEQDPFTGYLLW